MKRWQRLFLATLLVGLISSKAEAQDTDGSAAIVNEDIVTFSDVRKAVQVEERELREAGLDTKELVEQVRAVRLRTLRELIERRLIIQAFEREIANDPAMLAEITEFNQERAQEIIQSQYEGDAWAFVRTLKADGLSFRDFVRKIEDNTAYYYMVQRYVTNEVPIGDKAAYEKRYQEWLKELRAQSYIRMF